METSYRVCILELRSNTTIIKLPITTKYKRAKSDYKFFRRKYSDYFYEVYIEETITNKIKLK